MDSEPELQPNLKSVLEVRTAGDPDEPAVLWTDLSPRQITEAVSDLGTPVSPPVVRDWMEEQNLSRRQIEKVVEGGRKASTSTGLRTTVNVMRRAYETGRKAAEDFKSAAIMRFDDLLPKWNYVAQPQ